MSPEESANPLAWFKSRVDALAAKIGSPPDWLPTYGYSVDGGCPHIEHADGRFHFVVVERGHELQRISSEHPDEILFRVFEGVTFTMASDYELKHRKYTEDTRRLLFTKQLELLGQLSEHWRARVAAEQAEIVKKHPFIDNARQRLSGTEYYHLAPELSQVLGGEVARPDEAKRRAT